MYQEILPQRVDAAFVPTPAGEEVVSPSTNDHAESPGSFLDLLGELERYPATGDRRPIIATYNAWINRNDTAAATLYAAWFNLGVELAATGDNTGAMSAYRNAISLRPGFYPATINLGTLMELTGLPDAAIATWRQGLQPESARTALLDYRDRLAAACRAEQQRMPAVLHVGCGALAQAGLPPMFPSARWREIRVDADADTQPDFIAGLTDMHVISDGLADAVYASQAIQNLHQRDVPAAMQELYRVLKPGGFALIRIPDLQEVARYVAEGKLQEPLYLSPVGPVTPLDMLYGQPPSMATSNSFKSPRTGFTSATLAAALINARFGAAIVQRDPTALRLTAIAFRDPLNEAHMTRVRAEMLPAVDHPTVLYTPSR